MELETDKAVVEVPSTVSGVVNEVKVKEGDRIKVGQVIFTLEGAGASNAEAVRPLSKPVEHVTGQHGARLAFQAAIRAEGKTEEQALPPDQPRLQPATFSMPVQLGKVAGTEYREPVPAAPSTRRLAREIGVDIYEVKGTGPGGRISEDDVKAYAKALVTAVAAAAQAPPALDISSNRSFPTLRSGEKSNGFRCAEFDARRRSIWRNLRRFRTSRNTIALTSLNSNSCG